MGGVLAGFAMAPRGGAIAGAVSQASALPAYAATLASYFEFGFLLDALVLTTLLISYVAIAMFIGERIATQPAALPRLVRWVLAGLLFVCGLLVVTNPVAAWLQ